MLAVEGRGREWDDSSSPMPEELSKGEMIARRRKRAGLRNQAALARLAGVSLSTILRIEKNRNTHQSNYDTVLEALERAERAAGIRPDLSHPPATTEPSMKEGDDAAILAEAHAKLEALIDIMAISIEDIRRTMARLDARADKSKQKPA